MTQQIKCLYDSHLIRSLGQKNRHQYGIGSYAYIPFSLANPEAAESFVARAEAFVAEAKKNGTLPPGLAEQYDIQLKHLKDDSLPDLEVFGFPGLPNYLGEIFLFGSACS